MINGMNQDMWFGIYLSISYVSILIILSASILHIRKYSKILAKKKIFANEKLMLTHLISFFVLAMINITTIILYGINRNLVGFSMTVVLIETAVSILYSLAYFGNTVTMMFMFTKHSQTLSKIQYKSIKRQFFLVFANFDDLGKIN